MKQSWTTVAILTIDRVEDKLAGGMEKRFEFWGTA